MRRIKSGLVVYVVAVATLGAIGCVETDGDETATGAGGESALLGDDTVVYLEQGWDAATRAAFYQTTQGSRMLPYSWFLHLEQANNRELFRSRLNMDRMGFLVDAATAANPDGLPVGFAKDEHPVRGASIGLTCAGCHTGQLEVLGTKVRIDGGQSFGDLEKLQDGLLASLQATLDNADKFKRFSNDVLGKPNTEAARIALRVEVEKMRNWWSARVTRSRGLTPHGPTRTDAFTVIGNEVVCQLFGIPANCAPANAPTQFPFLWNTPDFDWVQYNSSVHSPLGRNVGEVTGVFAEASFDANGLVSSANLPNLHALENTLKTLRSPAWPAAILGDINQSFAAEGAAIYATACAGCHTSDPQPRTALNAYGKSFAKVNFETPLGALGTDSTAALSFATRRAHPGPFTAIAEAKGLIGPDGKASVAALLSISGTSIIQRFFAVSGFTDLQKLDFMGFRESLTPTTPQLTTYKARPLNGIAFTAPYLHNGSVASIYELLLPPAERKQTFYVGSKQFDKVRLGYWSGWGPAGTLFDTTAVGNSNAGHDYGTTLTNVQRFALIEYLKTL